MTHENHRHTLHHTANILVVAFAGGIVAAGVFVLLAEFIYDRGGLVTMLVIFSALMVYPAGGAYKRAVVDVTTKTNRCVVCHE